MCGESSSRHEQLTKNTNQTNETNEIEPHHNSQISLVCRKTGRPLPTNFYARRSHFMYCCVGDCTLNNKTNLDNDQSSCADGTACTCAADWTFNDDECPDIPPHADVASEEAAVTPPQFPFTTAEMRGFRDAEPTPENENEHTLDKENKQQKPTGPRLGAAEAYLGTAAEDPIDGLLIKTAHTAPKSRCSSDNCDDPSCPSSQNFCQAFMEWLEQRFGDDHADGPSSMWRTYENDEAMAFAAMEKQLDTHPKLSDHMVLDSGSNIHLLTLADARRLFKSRRRTSMTVTGIGGIRERCAGEGEIEVTVLDESGTHLNLSLGTGYTTNRVPVSLISAAQLLRSGAQIHLERNNSHIVLTNKKRINLIEKGGLLYIPALDYDADDEEDEEKQRLKAAAQAAAFLGFDPSAHENNNNNNEDKNENNNNNEDKNELTNDSDGFAAGVLATPTEWHSRFGHMLPMGTLKHVNEKNLVNGLVVKGHVQMRRCQCTTCQLVKVKTKGSNSRKMAEEALAPGDVVSMDIKHMPVKAFGGYRYLLCFVDHASKFCMDLALRERDSKTVVAATYRFVQYMNNNGHMVRKIQTDRGSEFFAYQDGELKEEDLNQYDKNTMLGTFTSALKKINIKHQVKPTASHEVYAESHFSWLSKAIDAQIFEARLSPCFWADAAIYACYLHNRIPCLKNGYTPYTRISGRATDWSHIRKFGAAAVWKIPNDKMAKYPGIPRGKQMIFVGFDDLSSGWRLFDPEQRSYVSGADDVDFYEDMTGRQDALRNFDRRRQLEKKKKEQPLIIDDNAASDDDRLSIEAIRNIYIDPEEVDGTTLPFA